MHRECRYWLIEIEYANGAPDGITTILVDSLLVRPSIQLWASDGSTITRENISREVIRIWEKKCLDKMDFHSPCQNLNLALLNSNEGIEKIASTLQMRRNINILSRWDERAWCTPNFSKKDALRKRQRWIASTNRRHTVETEKGRTDYARICFVISSDEHSFGSRVAERTKEYILSRGPWNGWQGQGPGAVQDRPSDSDACDHWSVW